jgi:cobaltochelatase CobT
VRKARPAAAGGVRTCARCWAYARRAFNPQEAMNNPPMAEVLSLMARERLTGEPPPPMARALVDMFRAEVEAKAGPDLDRLTGAVEDQKAFARIARTIIRDLEMGDDLSDAPEQPDEDSEGKEDGDPDASDDDDDGEGESQSPQQSSMDDDETQSREAEDADSQMMQSEDDPDAEDTDEPPEMGEGEQPARPDLKGEGRQVTYKVFTTGTTRSWPPRSCATRRELTRLRAYSTSSWRRCRTWCRAWPTGCSASCCSSRTAPGPSTWRKGSSTSPG